MRTRLIALTALVFALPAACVTINVYFPAAAAEKAAEQFVGKVIGGAPPETGTDTPPAQQPPGDSPGAMLLDLVVPSAMAAEPDLTLSTPQIQAIQGRMSQRFSSILSKYFASGAIGLTRDGQVAVRDAGAVPLAGRAALNQAVADDNRDRAAVYREIAVANGHPEWESKIRSTFASQWLAQAHAGWYYQDASGNWKRK
jgi:uncharacterized protein YdbL (DUF1318 family)